MIAHLKDIYRNRDGEWVISFSTPEDFTEEFDALSEKEVKVEIKRYSKKRSLDANAYCWVLIDLIAEKTGFSKSEVYRNAIRDIGGVSEIVCAQNEAVDKICKRWQSHGLGWQTETDKSKIEGCTNIILYCGSSEYDSKQMSRLIDSLKQDAEALGIPTVSPKEEERLLAQWGRKREGNDRNERGNDHSTESC